MPAGRPVIDRFQLTPEQAKFLESVAKSSTEKASRVARAKAILAFVKGQTVTSIAKDIGTTGTSVHNWLNKARQVGPIAALDDAKRSGRPATISDDARAWIVELACSCPKDLPNGPMQALWSYETLAKYIRENAITKPFANEVSKISKSTVSGILNSHDIKPHRSRYYLDKKDPDFEENNDEVLLLYKTVQLELALTEVMQHSTQPKNQNLNLFDDEQPGMQAIGNKQRDRQPTQPHGFVKRDDEVKGQGTVLLLAGIDLMTAKVHGLVRDKHTSDDFIAFLKHVDAIYPEEATINIVLDNHFVYTSKITCEYLHTRKGRFKFIFTPKHASWLNLIESWFGVLARTSLRGLRVSSKDALIQYIDDWMKQLNDEVSSYTWRWNMDSTSAMMSQVIGET